MKTWILTSLLTAALSPPDLSRAEAEKPNTDIKVSAQLSSVLLSDDFAIAVEQAHQQANVLRITHIKKVAKNIEFVLVKPTHQGAFGWVDAGSIVVAVKGKSADSTIEVSAPISTLLLRDEYASQLDAIKAQYKGKAKLRITQIINNDLGESKFIEVMIEKKDGSSWLSAGSIVGSYFYGPMGLVGFDGIYFKPAVSLPGGGASVGNQ